MNYSPILWCYHNYDFDLRNNLISMNRVRSLINSKNSSNVFIQEHLELAFKNKNTKIFKSLVSYSKKETISTTNSNLFANVHVELFHKLDICFHQIILEEIGSVPNDFMRNVSNIRTMDMKRMREILGLYEDYGANLSYLFGHGLSANNVNNLIEMGVDMKCEIFEFEHEIFCKWGSFIKNDKLSFMNILWEDVSSIIGYNNMAPDFDIFRRASTGDFWKHILLHEKYKDRVMVYGKLKPVVDAILGLDSGIKSTVYPYYPY